MWNQVSYIIYNQKHKTRSNFEKQIQNDTFSLNSSAVKKATQQWKARSEIINIASTRIKKSYLIVNSRYFWFVNRCQFWFVNSTISDLLIRCYYSFVSGCYHSFVNRCYFWFVNRCYYWFVNRCYNSLYVNMSILSVGAVDINKRITFILIC